MEALVEDYLALRRKLGCALQRQGTLLLNFARFSDRTGHQGFVTTELAVKWARLPPLADPVWWALRLDVVRRFARHQVALEPRTEVPPPRLLGPSYRRRQPHIFSDDEIAALLQAATALGPRGSLRPRTYTTIFGLLASTGLRVSEALRLARNEVDLRGGVLTVSETKFYKSRLVLLHPTTTSALQDYAEHRDRQCPTARAKTFFVSGSGDALKSSAVRATFGVLRRRLGWADYAERRSPKIRDLRHRFACRRLLAWYQEGAHLDQKVPALATYLGHVKVSDTYWYLTAVPELMAVAAARFERQERP